MARSDFPSIAVIGDNKQGSSVLDFLCIRFPKISRETWRSRIESGNVFYEKGKPVGILDVAESSTRIFYYKEVESETVIPFKEKVIFSDEHILAADKPHFLPVIPAGKYINETLLGRLKKSTGIEDIVPVNRLDRETAGIVLFSVNKQSRDAYYNLFRNRLVEKTYKAISNYNSNVKEDKWRIENRLVPGEPWFRMKGSESIDDKVNAITDIILDRRDNGLCHFTLHPETGQKHQLRVHMALLGFPILNDRFYPVLFPEEADDLSKPLKLLAEKISFKDPFTGKQHEFRSEQNL